jgi:hypothetical protein
VFAFTIEKPRRYLNATESWPRAVVKLPLIERLVEIEIARLLLIFQFSSIHQDTSSVQANSSHDAHRSSRIRIGCSECHHWLGCRIGPYHRKLSLLRWCPVLFDCLQHPVSGWFDQPYHGVHQSRQRSHLRRLRPNHQPAHQREDHREGCGHGRLHLRFVISSVHSARHGWHWLSGWSS